MSSFLAKIRSNAVSTDNSLPHFQHTIEVAIEAPNVVVLSWADRQLFANADCLIELIESGYIILSCQKRRESTSTDAIGEASTRCRPFAK